MKDEKKQLGDRIPAKMVEALKTIGDILKVPKQQLTEDAIAMWMGKVDPIAQARRDMAMQAFKAGMVECPFKTPAKRMRGVGVEPTAATVSRLAQFFPSLFLKYERQPAD